MAFAKRIVDLEFKLGQGAFGQDGADTVRLEGLRCSVSIAKQGIGYARADVQVWGMTLDLMNKLTVLNKLRFEQQRYNSIVITAGDSKSGVAMCFGGTIREAWADGRQPPDVMFHVSADSAMFELSKPVPPISFNGSVDAALVLNGIAGQMGMGLENNGVTATLKNPYWPSSLKSQLEKVCEAANCEYTIDTVGNVLAVWPKGQGRSGASIKVAPDTGLVGYPSFTQSGIQLTMLYNPSIDFGRSIDVESQFTPANGKWTVVALNHRLDCQVPGGQWFTDIECSFLDHPL